MKILVTIPGIGDNNFNEKKEFLKINKRIIENTFTGDIDFLIFNYSDNDFSDIDNIKVIKEKGIIGQFIFKHLNPETLNGYDYIILMMDDVLLSDNINIDKMIKVYKDNNLNILSPSLTHDSKFSHNGFMLESNYYKGCLRITNFSEFFFYLMDIKSYERYYKIYDDKTYWTWGVDLCISLLGLKIGILNDYIIKHYYTGSYNKSLPDPKVEMKIKEYNFGKINEMKNIEIKKINQL